ncbi:Protein HflC [Desulfovibrionales bacterium]
MTKKSLLMGIVCFVFLVVIFQSVYIITQTQAAILLQLGMPIGHVKGPGLHYKLPFIQNVVVFDIRLLEYSAKSAEILTSDKKTLVVDNYSKWRIKNPLDFYCNVRSYPAAQARLDDIIYAQLRVALGRYTLTEIVSSKRPEIMAEVTAKSSQLVAEYGIEVIDVRIKRTDLPTENEKAIYNRMRSERERQAKQYRSEGQEEAARIKSEADRDKTIILAEAQREAESLRGQGDAEAAAVYTKALSQSPELYSFKRRLDAYIQSLRENTKLILTLDSRFLQQLR